MVGLEGGAEHLGRVHPQAGEEFRVGTGDPGRGLEQTVPFRVFAQRDQDLPDRSLDPAQIDDLLDRSAGEFPVDQPGGQVVQLVGVDARLG